jgi:hypothetical protein
MVCRFFGRLMTVPLLVVLALAKRHAISSNRAVALQITTRNIMKDKPVNVHNLCEQDEIE